MSRRVTTERNLFAGVNPLLHSYLLESGEWAGFHNHLITYLTRELIRPLATLGYRTTSELSLQIRRPGEPAYRARPDVAILDPTQRPAKPGAVALATRPRFALETFEEIEPDDDPRTFAIRIDRGAGNSQQPVAWIEVLSPSNKGGDKQADRYRDKRRDLLAAGVVFVELDYLHRPGPTFNADQPGVEPSAYRVVVLDPRPNMQQGWWQLIPVHIAQAIPMINIPLNDGDKVTLDLDAAYQSTYLELFFGSRVDYAALPADLDTYRPEDQTRIVARMVAALQADVPETDLPPDPDADMDALRATFADLTAAQS